MIQCVMDSLGMGTGETTGKKTWMQLKEEVVEIRRQLSMLTVSLPTNLMFRKMGDGRERIYFLGAPNNGWEMNLLYVDIPMMENVRNLIWEPVVDVSLLLLTGSCRQSREELLQWERKRLSTWGINSYELHPQSGRIVFPAASSLYHCLDTGSARVNGQPEKIKTSLPGAKLNPQICPCNSDLVAFLNNDDIYVTMLSSGETERVTWASAGPDDAFSAGNPSYVMQEEFNRYIGFWWQPTSINGTYRILYEEVDERSVTVLRFPSPGVGECEELRFPRTGTDNAISQLKMAEFSVQDGRIDGGGEIRTLNLRSTLQQLFPWAEYMVRAGWTPQGHHVWVEMLDRRQSRLELCLIDPDEFVDLINCDASHTGSTWFPVVHTIHTQNSFVWINVHELLVFLPYEKNASTVSFVIASEKTGYRHLYLHHYTFRSPRDDVTSNHCQTSQPEGDCVALTSGDWAVVGKRLWVDPTRQLVFFMGLRETPLEKHLYVVSLRNPGNVRLLTPLNHSHYVYFNDECTLCVVLYSNSRTLPACQVLRVWHTDWSVDGISLVPAGFLQEPRAVAAHYSPELFSHTIKSGDVLYAMVLKPYDFDPSRKYPTVLHVYGGPEVQLVTNTFKGMRQLRMHMLAALGYCVIAIDSRGSQHRGLAFEGHIKCRMGTVEMDDQVEVLKHLSNKLGYIDMERVGIHGWSYGGYLSLMALVLYPSVFKVSIAGAPVTSWHLYDTGYTERYMDLPSVNPTGYNNSNVLMHVRQFPNEENRLLIIHGLIDENVHFYHTTELVNALIQAGKPYQLQVYPSERHSLRNMDASKHYETVLLSFLQNNL